MTADNDTASGSVQTPASSERAGRPRRRSKKEERAFQIKAAIAVIVVVSAIIIAAVIFTERNAEIPLANPEHLEITALSSGDKPADAVKLRPYQACALGKECDEGTPTGVKLPPDGSVTITVPPQIKQADWRIIKIYEDEKFDTESNFDPGTTDRAEIAGSYQGSPLKVAEVHAVMIGKDEAGDEQAYTVVWAIQPK